MANTWWQTAVFYQIYPRSFMDSNGDGIGDLQGIIERLDYLRDLGIDAIWISPIFPSPMADFGYDVADYTGIHPMFGNMADFDRLLAEAHARNLRIVLDFVPNHSSEEHPWFLASRSSREHPKRDWYIWKDAKADGSPPNNWESIFGGSAWEWDEKTGQYYLHSFLKEQPDLNWRNPEVVEAMHNALRFWLDKGVDGFRVDAVLCCFKHADFPDNPPIAESSPFHAFSFNLEPAYTMYQPEMHNLHREMRKVFDGYDHNPVMIGETWVFELDHLVKYYGKNFDEFHVPFNFMPTQLPWNAKIMRDYIGDYYRALPKGVLPNFVFGNHDIMRPATRFGPENHRSVGMLLLTIWGIPTMYYGDELGMEDVSIPPEKEQDPWGLNNPGKGLSRDPERTPMQWSAASNAGFSDAGVETWLPIAPNYQEVNVEKQENDSQSTLNFYKKLLKFRRNLPALHSTDFTFVENLPEDIMAYIRSANAEKLLVIINFAGDSYQLNFSHLGKSGKLLLSSKFRAGDKMPLSNLDIEPNECMLIALIP